MELDAMELSYMVVWLLAKGFLASSLSIGLEERSLLLRVFR